MALDNVNWKTYKQTNKNSICTDFVFFKSDQNWWSDWLCKVGICIFIRHREIDYNSLGKDKYLQTMCGLWIESCCLIFRDSRHRASSNFPQSVTKEKVYLTLQYNLSNIEVEGDKFLPIVSRLNGLILTSNTKYIVTSQDKKKHKGHINKNC